MDLMTTSAPTNVTKTTARKKTPQSAEFPRTNNSRPRGLWFEAYSDLLKQLAIPMGRKAVLNLFRQIDTQRRGSELKSPISVAN